MPAVSSISWSRRWGAQRSPRFWESLCWLLNGSWPPLQKLLQLRPASGVHDVLWLQPTASRLADAETHKVQIRNAVGISRDCKLHSDFLAGFAMDIRQVESVWLRIDFDHATSLAGRF